MEMKNDKMRSFFSCVILLLFILPVTVYATEDVPRISKDKLKGMLGDPNVVILDARIAKEWRKSEIKIKGAHRADPHDVSSWAKNYSKDQKIVVYCS
jgi:rhodanese-related sulfurtransferase